MYRLAVLLCVWPLSTIIGCAPHFMPIEDDYVVFDLNMPADYEFSVLQALICMPNKSACGRRRMSDSYDPDEVIIDYGGHDFDPPFEATGSGNERIEAGAFRGQDALVGPDDLQSVRFNDLSPVPIDIPPRFDLSSPTKNAELSRASLNNVKVEWSPSGKGFPMHWKLIPVDNEIELLPCDKLTWGSFEGEGEDTGFVDIPIDVFPSDLPPEGCPVAIRVSRIKSFDLPEGIAQGDIRSRVTAGVFFRIMP